MKKTSSNTALGPMALGRSTALSHSQFDLQAQIGTGSFGTVFRAVHRPTGAQCAIKRIDLESSDDDIEEIQREIAILAECNNHHITRYFGCFMHEFELWIAMEYLGAGSCLDLIKDLRPNHLPEAAVAEIMAQVVQGLVYLHRSGKIHRDIKAANVLISDTGEVKIADFGVAAQLSNNLSRRNTFVGTPFWMAPEVINEQDYSFEADVWSLGITAMELALGKPPRSHLHPMKALFSIPRQSPPRLDSKFSPEFQDFVVACLQMEPSRRRPVTELAKHPFLARRDRQTLLILLHQRLPPVPVTDVSQILDGKQPTDASQVPADGSQTIDTLRGFESPSPLPSPKRGTPRKSASPAEPVSLRRPDSTSEPQYPMDSGSPTKPGSPTKSASPTSPTKSRSSSSDRTSSESTAYSSSQASQPLSLSIASSSETLSATRTSTADSQRTLQEPAEDDADDWDFDTLKPQPSLEQLLQHPPPSPVEMVPPIALAPPRTPKPAFSTAESMRSSTGTRLASNQRPPSGQWSPTSRRSERSVSQATYNQDTVAADTVAGTNLVKIFHHAARKFRDPLLDDISDLLRSDPPTVGVENYLVRRIARLAASADPKPAKTGHDPIEQILLDKWLSEVREVHG